VRRQNRFCVTAAADQTAVVMDLPEPDRRAFVEVNRTTLRVWEWGPPDAPAVICAHGAHDHGRMWDGFAPQLAELGFRVVAPDLRGHGESGRLPHGHVWGMSSLDLAMLARELGPPVGIVGHSFGAGLSMFAAGVFPELFRWVVNLDGLGPAWSGEDDDEDEWTFATGAANSIEWCTKTLLGPPRLYASTDEMVERRAKTNYRLPREWVEHLVRHGSVETEGGFVWKADPAFRTGLPGDWDPAFLEAELAMTTPPVLVLTGGEDDAWSEHTPEVIAARLACIPDARHEVVTGAGHYVHIEQPAAVLDAIRRFLAELEEVR
jgi:pimeloyl-ACP methyl ester carboxylesterase